MTATGFAGPWRIPRAHRRAIGHAIGLVLAALVAWLIWRGYQTPEFLLDVANWRLC